MVASHHGTSRVLCFSPGFLGALHGLWEGTLLQCLRLRGAQVHYVLCDGAFSECDKHWAATNPRDALSCARCQAQACGIAAGLGLDYRWVGRYLRPHDLERAARWAASIPADAYLDATYQQWPIGEWVRSSIHSHFRSSDLDSKDPDLRRSYKRYLCSGLIACFALERIFDECRPDLLLLFNGRVSATRIALELARERNIRVVCHERGWLPEHLRLYIDCNCLSRQPIEHLWHEWREIPLLASELERISQHLHRRSHGQALAWHPAYSPPLQPDAEIRKALGLRSDSALWALFTSSDDEVIAGPDWQSPFGRQIEWIRATIDFCRAHPAIDLVIRMHPNTAGARAVGDNRRQFDELCRLRGSLPANATLVLPEEEISSYALMQQADLGLIFNSTVGLEMSCLGKPVVVAAGALVADKSFVTTVRSAAEYPQQLQAFTSQPTLARAPEIRRLALRFAYAAFFRFNLHFPLVALEAHHTGKIAYQTLQELMPGRNSHVDRITGVILDGDPICPAPTAEEARRDATEESNWIAMGGGTYDSCRRAPPRPSPEVLLR